MINDLHDKIIFKSILANYCKINRKLYLGMKEKTRTFIEQKELLSRIFFFKPFYVKSEISSFLRVLYFRFEILIKIFNKKFCDKNEVACLWHYYNYASLLKLNL